MWYSKQLRLVRRARKVARNQQHQLLALELDGIVAITLHSATRTLTIATERTAGAQVVDTLREALRDRRRLLQTETCQLRRDRQESDDLRTRKSPPGPPFAVPLPAAAPDAQESF